VRRYSPFQRKCNFQLGGTNVITLAQKRIELQKVPKIWNAFNRIGSTSLTGSKKAYCLFLRAAWVDTGSELTSNCFLIKLISNNSRLRLHALETSCPVAEFWNDACLFTAPTLTTPATPLWTTRFIAFSPSCLLSAPPNRKPRLGCPGYRLAKICCNVKLKACAFACGARLNVSLWRTCHCLCFGNVLQQW